jgi:hypothetical protein
MTKRMNPNEFLRQWRQFQRDNPAKAKEMEAEASILIEIERGLRCPRCRERRELAAPGDLCEECLEAGEG